MNAVRCSWLGGSIALFALLCAASQPPATPTSTAPASKPPIAPQASIMYWHDRAFGQINVGIARKDEEKVEQHAWLLAELANINQHHNDDPEFGSYATAIRGSAVELAAAAAAKDFDKAKTLSKAISKSCKSCHDTYR